MKAAAPEHPSAEQLHEVLRGEAPPATVRWVVRHLLAGCAACARSAGALRAPAPAEDLPEPQPVGPYDAVVHRVTRRVLAHQKSLQSARILVLELMSHAAVEGLGQIHSTRRYACLALCELLLKKARESWLLKQGLEEVFADLAAGVAEQLDLELYGAQVVPDLRAAPWAYLVNAQRLEADFQTAESILALVRGLVAVRGSRPGAQGLWSVAASLRLDQARFDEASGWIHRLAGRCRRVGDRHGLGRNLLRRASLEANRGRPAKAVDLVQRAGQLVDPRLEPRLAILANHSLIWSLQDSGRFEEAQDTLARARRLYRQRKDRSSLARLRWLEGKLDQGRGETEGAEEAFADARVRLTREGLGYEAALASMDLAFLYAYQGRADRMRRQAQQLLPLFKSQEMYGETLVALTAYRRHVDGRDPDRRPEELIAAVGGYLEKMRRRKNTLQLAAPRAALRI